ncbi:Zinc-type alcohol dehydrogenase-like protein C2E1P3.01 [Grifola frondosa]|uniref:Zinc-type alcohol dehydrogenase-like protein C2E1P3.01 n=1 Tax=Grifola frondosa TaxID=5627 RepID=A0A1C7LNJ3_GRIFR|nr:Zinc-type alcohol dehydrogenase-like protein C2E1P3.01 [Grifola frondosa]
MPAQQKALLLQSKQGQLVVGTRDIPTPGAGEVLIKIEATALNPVDWKVVTFGIVFEKFPAVLGMDGAGFVDELGDGVTSLVKGDRVLFQGWFDNSHDTFQQYAIIPAEFAVKVPNNISIDEAASIPSALATAIIALYNKQDPARSLGLYPPWEEGGAGKYAGKSIFILGGASSVGQYVIQVARLSGFSPIITTASLHNALLLTSLGATHVIDRKLSHDALVAEATRIAGGPIEIVYDAISDADTQNVGYDVLAPEESDQDYNQMLWAAAEEINRGISLSLYSKLTQLLEDGTIKPNPIEVLPSGLEGIIDGLERLKHNLVSGKKLVAHPQESL